MNPLNIAITFLLAVPAIVSADTTFGDVLAKTPSLSMLSKLYQVDRLLFDVLEDPVDLTYFAPSDEAMTEFLRTTRGSSDYLTNKATRYRIFKDLFYYMTIKGAYRNRELFDTPKLLETYLEDKKYHTSQDHKGQYAMSTTKDGNSKIYGGQNHGIQISKPDISFGSGFLHVVDGFFKMPKNFTATADALAYEDWLEYIDTAGMRGTLDSLSTATYFIPAVDAKKAPPSNSSELLELIQYHVIEGRAFFSTDLSKQTTRVDTANGDKLFLTLRNDRFYVNDARVLKSDIITTGGVIHVLDRPLDNTKSTAIDKQGRKCHCVGQYCINVDGHVCAIDEANKPTKKSSVFGASDVVPVTESGASSKGPASLGALAALSAVIYCIIA